jgi:hypothetical protein
MNEMRRNNAAFMQLAGKNLTLKKKKAEICLKCHNNATIV